MRLRLAYTDKCVTVLQCPSPTPDRDMFVQGFCHILVGTHRNQHRDYDPCRIGTLLDVFKPDFGFRKYVDHALDYPMIFVVRQGI